MRILLLTAFACCIVAFFVPVHGKAAFSQRCSMMPAEDGDCDSETDKWYYNKNEGSCMNFMYGDCPRGGNIFGSIEECVEACTKGGPKEEKDEPSGKPTKGSKGHHEPPDRSGSSEENPPAGGRHHDEGSEETRQESVKGREWSTKSGGSGTEHKKKQHKHIRPTIQRPIGVRKLRPPPGSEENEAGTSSESETGHGGNERQTKSGGHLKSPHHRPTRPTKGRPGGRTKHRRPPTSGRHLNGTCVAGLRKRHCEDNSDMWFNDITFSTCTRVPEGMCPSVGSFFASCEDCMQKCRKKIHT